jgi:hypothetical protein
VPEAFSHPAKVAYGLAERIYQYLLASGYVKRNDIIVDPFAGIAGFAFHAMRYGFHYRGRELEPKFVTLGQQNIDLWNSRYSQWMPTWGTAQIEQGDSRYLAERGTAVIGSPPFGQEQTGGGISSAFRGKSDYPLTAGQGGKYQGYVDQGDTPGQLGAMKEGTPPQAIIGSPPYASDTVHGRNGIDLDKTQRPGKNSQAALMDDYGKTDGNIGHMPPGTPPQGIIGSPPYADAISGSGEGPGARYDHVYHNGDNATKNSSQSEYGASEGQLGSMAVVSSPPFERQQTGGGIAINGTPHQTAKSVAPVGYQDQGDTPGQLGNNSGDTFWHAAAEIVEQCYQLLPVGGVAAWVTGDFVRKGERVYFGKQWATLCESAGFTLAEHIIAWKREPGPVQIGMFEDVDKTIDRVSFFRRLANDKNPDNAILNEDVWIMVKA